VGDDRGYGYKFEGFEHISPTEAIQREALHENIGPAEIGAAAAHALAVAASSGLRTLKVEGEAEEGVEEPFPEAWVLDTQSWEWLRVAGEVEAPAGAAGAAAAAEGAPSAQAIEALRHREKLLLGEAGGVLRRRDR
jgi:hypothetical protein